MPSAHAAEDAAAILATWLEGFGQALEMRSGHRASELFLPDGYWKDILAFSWEHRYFSGHGAIADAFDRTIETTAPTNFRLSPDRMQPRLTRRAKREVVEGYFDFDTGIGKASSFVRLALPDSVDGSPRAWVLLTTLQELHGLTPPIGRNRPTGDAYAHNALGRSWADEVARRQAYANHDPEVVVIGGGHAGLVAAARLDQLGVDTLVVERTPRIGDVWRNRYRSLTLHNEVMANHLPYMSYPENWPVWLTKDHLARWLEAYASCMALSVWTGTTVENAAWSDGEKRWTLTLRRDGDARIVHARHIVMATGVSGSVPHFGTLPGLEAFAGDIVHSSAFEDGQAYTGKSAIVVGTGNSAHDIAQDLHVKGAASVDLLQRGPTCVISLQPGAEMIYRIYTSGDPIEDVDLLAAAIPYPLLEDSYRFITKKAAQLDESLLRRLNERGFRTYFGSDGTGFQMMYMRGEGGYYIDVGCSELVADGKIGVIAHDGIDRFEAEGLRMQDGTFRPADLVVLATGFKNMQENVRSLFGDAVANRVGPVWGFDEHHQMRAMWRRTGQEGLWITGGSLLDSRIFSRFMALEIKAALQGILPARAELPLAREVADA